ncbi:P-loop containing nucleoside triphosphate hydrolase protein [Hypoxylon sp. FL0890]|nr:P-loop containing nucleoside triphosphate hydrolase protein [Hypoxylon sp. FL0890]
MDGIGVKQLYEEQKELLDMLADLRKHGLFYSLDLPQIVVVGDQSSGKSSLLEALSGFRFSAKDRLYTRFATELNLSTNSRHTIVASIQSPASSSEEATSFKNETIEKDSIPDIIEEFESMILKDGAEFSEDVLKIKSTAPNGPCLTLVDLPGFHRSGDKEQPDAYREIVSRLVERYMTCKDSIILAVIPASKGLSQEDVISLIEGYEQVKDRTIGVLTKVDSLAPDSDDEYFSFWLAETNPTSEELPLGWHVVRNLGPEDSSDTEEQRDEKERSFLESSIWPILPSEDRGVESLRKKLSGILLSRIKSNLDGLIECIEKKIKDHKIRLEQLGEPRLNPKQIRMHLEKIASRFHTLCLNAVEGNYDDEFFGGLFHDQASTRDNKIRKLRALIHNLNRSFVYVLETKGSRRIILSKTSNASQHSTTHPEPKPTLPISLQTLVGQYKFEDPEEVPFDDIAEDLGCFSNDRLAINLFRDQSQPWEEIARRHIQLVLTVTKAFVEKLLSYITDPDKKAYTAILSEIVHPFFDQKSVLLESKLEELLRHYKSGYPQFHHTDFGSLLGHKRRRSPDPEVLRDLMETCPEFFTEEARLEFEKMSPSEGSNSSGVHDLIHKAEAYYEMSLRTFADNVIILAIENCLIRDLPSMVTIGRFNEMEDHEIEQLASESPKVQEERDKLQAACDAFTKGLEICSKYKLQRFNSVPSILVELEETSSPRVENTSIIGTAKDSTAAAENVSIDTAEDTPTTTVENPSTAGEAKGNIFGSLASPLIVEAQSNVQSVPETLAKPNSGNYLSKFNPPAGPKASSFPSSVGQNPSNNQGSLLSTAKLPSVPQQSGGNSNSGPFPMSPFGTLSTPANTGLDRPRSELFRPFMPRTFGSQSHVGQRPSRSPFGKPEAPKTGVASQGLLKPFGQTTPATTLYWSDIGTTFPYYVSLPVNVSHGVTDTGTTDISMNICFQPPYVKYSPEELRCLALSRKPTSTE